jgi:hypothetical protein
VSKRKQLEEENEELNKAIGFLKVELTEEQSLNAEYEKEVAQLTEEMNQLKLRLENSSTGSMRNAVH